MNNNSYEQFFTKAQKAKRGDEPVVDKVRFSTKPEAKPTAKKPATSLNQRLQSEQRLRNAVRMKRAKAPFPWKAVAGLSVCLILAGFYVASPETFENALNKIEIRAMTSAGAEEKAAEKSKGPSAEKENAAAKTASGEHAKGGEEKSAVSEELSHFEKLKQRKEELDLREKELSELEEELQKQKVELDKRLTQLDEMRAQIAQTLKDRVEVDTEKVNKLVDLYSNMKPKQAADIIGSLNEELAVEVMAKMKKKNAAEIMNLLQPEKARILSEKYTGYRRISSTDKEK
jgi:flagellar motility protein MotE (MotC chaperone)